MSRVPTATTPTQTKPREDASLRDASRLRDAVILRKIGALAAALGLVLLALFLATWVVSLWMTAFMFCVFAAACAWAARRELSGASSERRRRRTRRYIQRTGTATRVIWRPAAGWRLWMIGSWGLPMLVMVVAGVQGVDGPWILIASLWALLGYAVLLEVANRRTVERSADTLVCRTGPLPNLRIPTRVRLSPESRISFREREELLRRPDAGWEVVHINPGADSESCVTLVEADTIEEAFELTRALSRIVEVGVLATSFEIQVEAIERVVGHPLPDEVRQLFLPGSVTARRLLPLATGREYEPPRPNASPADLLTDARERSDSVLGHALSRTSGTSDGDHVWPDGLLIVEDCGCSVYRAIDLASERLRVIEYAYLEPSEDLAPDASCRPAYREPTVPTVAQHRFTVLHERLEDWTSELVARRGARLDESEEWRSGRD